MPTLRLLPELEQALRQVPGIRAASVVTGPDAVPTEIHIVANHAKGAKQVVRDVIDPERDLGHADRNLKGG
mgnify:CR=1 FL=1